MKMDLSEASDDSEVVIVQPSAESTEEHQEKKNNNEDSTTTAADDDTIPEENNKTMKMLMQVTTPNTTNETDPDEEYCFEESTIYEDKNAFILKLIEKIKLNRCLYDHTSAGWRSIETKKEVWEKLGKELQVDHCMYLLKFIVQLISWKKLARRIFFLLSPLIANQNYQLKPLFMFVWLFAFSQTLK